VRQSGEPSSPIQNAPVTDVGGFWQAGRPRRVDQQCPVVDGDTASLGWCQRASLQSIQDYLDTCFFGIVAVQPDLRHPLQVRPSLRKRGRKLMPKNDMVRSRDVDAVSKRRPNQFGVDERHDATNPTDAEPGGDVIRTARHQQANRIARANAREQCPTRVAVYPIGQGPVAERLNVRYQSGPIRLPDCPALDNVSKQLARAGLDAGGKLNGL
jgi:hypothetical protein